MTLFAVYRAERTCLSSAAVTTDSNKCYADFQRRLQFITDARKKQRQRLSHSEDTACILLYVHVRNS